MRKRLFISFLFIAFLLVGGVAFAGGIDQLGQGGFPSDAHIIYRFVRNAGNAELAADTLATWDLSEDDGVTITTSTISGDSAVAGILKKAIAAQATSGNTAAEDIGKANWGLLQTYGLSQVNNAAGFTPNAGDAFSCSTTAGEAAPYSVGGLGATANQQGMAGFYYDSATSGEDDVEVFLVLD